MTAIKKIIHVVASLNHGGTEVSCRNLIQQFSSMGVASGHVLAVSEGQQTIRRELCNLAPVSVLSAMRLPRMLQFWYLCRRLRPDGIIYHFIGLDQTLLALAGRWAGIRFYHCNAGNPASEKGQPGSAKWQLILGLNRLLSCPIVSASAWIQMTLKRLGTLPPRSRVIHNGCMVDDISNRAECARLTRNNAIFRIGMVSRLDPIKDFECLVEAFSETTKRFPDKLMELDIIGEGPLREIIHNKVVELGLSERVRLLGNRNDIPEALGELDLFVLSTSKDEGFGIVLIEALAAGVPVIASDVPACREVLQGGRLGKLVPPGDVTQLAEAFAQFLIGAEAGAILPSPSEVTDSFGVKRMAEHHLSVLFDG